MITDSCDGDMHTDLLAIGPSYIGLLMNSIAIASYHICLTDFSCTYTGKSTS